MKTSYGTVRKIAFCIRDIGARKTECANDQGAQSDTLCMRAVKTDETVHMHSIVRAFAARTNA